MKGILQIDSWAGRRNIPVEIIATTWKGRKSDRNIKVKLLQDCLLPNRMGHTGQVILVPKHAVKMEIPLES